MKEKDVVYGTIYAYELVVGFLGPFFAEELGRVPNTHPTHLALVPGQIIAKWLLFFLLALPIQR